MPEKKAGKIKNLKTIKGNWTLHPSVLKDPIVRPDSIDRMVMAVADQVMKELIQMALRDQAIKKDTQKAILSFLRNAHKDSQNG